MPRLHTVIGDLVGSRRLPDRAAAQSTLGAVLVSVNEQLRPAQPFEATVGDEVQGAFADLPGALLGSLLVRLRLLPAMDMRFGIGTGEVTVHDAARRPLLQDGPGWWAARAALDELGRRRSARSWYDGPEAALVNAFLLTRDGLVDRLSDRGLRLLDGALGGLTQGELAEREGISQAAVSQQFGRGVGAVRDAQLVLSSVVSGGGSGGVSGGGSGGASGQVSGQASGEEEA